MDAREMHTSDQTISVGEWVLNLFLLSIPIVNIVMLCVWAFGSNTPTTKANFAKAGLIWLAIGVAIYLFMALFAFSSMSSMMG